MKVIYLLDVFPAISETFVLNEMLAMQRKAVEIEIYAFSKTNDKITHPRAADIKQTTYLNRPSTLKIYQSHFYWLVKNPRRYFKALGMALNKNNGISNLFINYLTYVTAIAMKKPDHIHAHFGWRASNMALLVNFLTGISFTFTTHGSDIFALPPNNYKIKALSAKKLITVSNYNKKYLITNFGIAEDKIAVIYCGVDFDKVFPDKKMITENVIVSVAQLKSIKGLDVLIKACFELKKQGIKIKCSIIGEGVERKNLEKLITDLELKDEVKLLGNKTQDEVFAILAKSKIKVLPSRRESMSVALMEAMSMRVPVIGPAVFGVSELVEDGESGFLVPPDEVSILAERIKKLLLDYGLQKTFASNGYKKVFIQFNLKAETDKLLNVWKS